MTKKAKRQCPKCGTWCDAEKTSLMGKITKNILELFVFSDPATAPKSNHQFVCPKCGTKWSVNNYYSAMRLPTPNRRVVAVSKIKEQHR